MPFFLDTQETVQRFGSALAEFRSLLDTNHVRHGSPDDLFEFTRTLEHSNQFRMDLSALVKSVVSKEREDLLLTDMMSIIAASVGGRSVTDTTADITRPTNTLMEFLLGTGCWKQFGSPSHPNSQRAAPPLKPAVPVEETQPIRISLPASPAKSAIEVPQDKAGLLEISNELRQTLSRLESNTQQVKLHLDSIERRIGTMGSLPDTHPANKLAGLEPLVHRSIVDTAVPKVVPTAEEIPAIELPLATRGRAIFSGPVHLDESRTDEDDDFSAPTFAYGTEKKRSIVPLAIFIVLAAMAAAVFFYVHSSRGQALLVRFQEARWHLGGSQATSSPAAPVPSTASTHAGAASTPPPSKGQPADSAAIAASATAPSATSNAVSSSAAPSDTQPISDNPKVRYVSANVMEGYLLSAPRPEYPAQARINHIEGQVALQATISRSGSIKTLHVIKGPASLQSAAVAAVRTWRYRPYSVDGQAQDVATTVYVDFTLKPPPVLVH